MTGSIGRSVSRQVAKMLRDRIASKHVKDQRGCWIFSGAKNSSGYGRLMVTCMTPSNIMAHHASYLAVYRSIPRGFVVMHTCDEPACVNPCHLKLGTQKENVRDMIVKGRAAFPVNPKLSPTDVIELRRKAKTHSVKDLCKEYGLSNSCIRQAISDRHWRNV